MTSVPTITLNNGLEMTLLGIGVVQIADLEECQRSVYDAITTGYRLICSGACQGCGGARQPELSSALARPVRGLAGAAKPRRGR